jgi:hypothetical protein
MRIAAVAIGLGLCCLGEAALAYRPFDGTDAAVADPGEFELEAGAGYRREGPSRNAVAPAAVFNFGIAPGWEAVLQGEVDRQLTPRPPLAGLVGAGVFLKNVLRQGVLQDKSGPSIATEFGALLPGLGGDPGAGASWAGIVSYRWGWLTAHLNAEIALARDHHADTFLGVIVEGPRDWPVRPVAEVFRDREAGAVETVSGLIGAIWQAGENLAVDLGLREASIGRHTVDEVRAGLTIGLPLR